MAVELLFRIDIGFDKQRGYAAVVAQSVGGDTRQKGIKGNSPEQLISRIRNVFLEEMHKRRNFPLESEPAAARHNIITPEDPGYNGGL